MSFLDTAIKAAACTFGAGVVSMIGGAVLLSTGDKTEHTGATKAHEVGASLLVNGTKIAAVGAFASTALGIAEVVASAFD